MILYFPDSDTLRLALTSGTVPTSVSLKPAVAGFDDEGHVWIESAEVLPRPAQTALSRLGVQIKKSSGAPLSMDVCCWLGVLALERTGPSAEHNQPAPQAPVLFELTDTSLLSGLVAEILRLGNDRQSFRWLEKHGQTLGLLRVIGPPYYSLLRALDRSGQEAAPRAYVEEAPGVWMEIGYHHPFAEQIKPPKGHVLLLPPPREWVFLEEGPFIDIYDILEFELPGAKVPWQPADLEHRLRVPLRLTHGGKGEDAELWVLREQAFDRLDTFVRDADDQLLARLAFAVCENHQDKCIVLRVRPSKLPPPILVLQGVAFRSFLKLPNLFLPCATQLHPPLRRDAVRKLLADDPDRITWLYPQPDGSFTPESIPDQAFRPLTNWVDYVLDHDHVALQTWVEAARFDFEPFICKDDQKATSPKPSAKESRREGKEKGKREDVAVVSSASFKAVSKSRKAKAAEDDQFPELPRLQPSQLQERLHTIEKQFLDMAGALDSPERQAMWPQMAVLNKALKNESDATVCFVNALWEETAMTPHWARVWAKGELLSTKEEITGEELDLFLSNAEPGLTELRGLASILVWATYQKPPSPAVVQRLPKIQRYLETHENWLPVRGAWLSWCSLAKLSHGDVLALARARDRLLERLFQQGLRSDHDLPSFLRFSGTQSSNRFRVFRDWLLRFPGMIRRWLHEVNFTKEDPSNPKNTEAYAYLMLAFGLARLGESREARRLLQQATERLGERDEVHSFLLEAYGFRIQQALEGKPHTGPLSAVLMEYLTNMEKEAEKMKKSDKDRSHELGMACYKINRLRERSLILEPHETVEPYRFIKKAYFTETEKTLDALGQMTDRKALSDKVRRLLHHVSTSKTRGERDYAQVVEAALEVAPRLGGDMAQELLAHVEPASAALPELKDQAALLEEGLFVAAHFDLKDYVQGFVKQFQSLLREQSGTQSIKTLDTLAGQCFRGLRKLGMRDEIDSLLRQIAEGILQGQDLKALRNQPYWAEALCTLLHVASGWFYFGNDAQARQVLNEIRAVLYKKENDPEKLQHKSQMDLACTYAITLGQAPVEVALRGIEELLQKLTRIHVTFTVGTHYSLYQLQVIEAVVLAVVTEDFAVGSMARHWMEDDEFLVRRRIHRDMNALMSH